MCVCVFANKWSEVETRGGDIECDWSVGGNRQRIAIMERFDYDALWPASPTSGKLGCIW